MRTITFYSYKGGTGRTLAVANTARFLARFGYRVFVLDFDLEAPGLHYKFGLRRESAIELEDNAFDSPVKGTSQETPLTGLVDWIHEFRRTNIVSALTPYVHDVERVPSGSKGRIWLMPAGDAPSPQYSRQLATLDLPALFNVEVAPGANVPQAVALFLELKERIASPPFNSDYLLIDSRTGLTEIGGIAVRLLPDVVVCLVHNNPENKAGARKVLRNVKTAYRPNGQAIEMVATLVRIPEMPLEKETALLNRVRAGFNEQADDPQETLDVKEVLPLHSDPDLQIVEDLRVGGDITANESILLRDYFKLFRSLGLQKNLKPEEQEVLAELAEADRSDTFRPLLLDVRRSAGESIAFPVRIRERLRERNKVTLKVVPSTYMTGPSFQKFISLICGRLVSNLGLDLEVDELSAEAVRWDLMPVHLREGVLDFCADVYYLTENRAHLVEIVQLGWCSTYTSFLHKESPLRKQLCYRLDRELPEVVKAMLKDFPDLAVGVLGDTAAASEANRQISSLLSATSLISKGSEQDLLEWIRKEDAPKIVVCDNVVARMLNSLKGGEDYSSARTFSFYQRIPVGIVYPREDREWRKELSRAIADSLIEFLRLDGETGRAGWAQFEGEFQDNSLDALNLGQLRTSLLLDMPFDAAIEWDRKFRSLSELLM